MRSELEILKEYFLDMWDRSYLHEDLCNHFVSEEQIRKQMDGDEVWQLWCKYTGDSTDQMVKDVLSAKDSG